jgi:enoyl-CoA hydratase
MFQLDVADGIALLEMKSGKVNAMSLEFVIDLAGTIGSLANDPAVDGVILAGNGRVFSAGIDLKQLVAERPDWLDEFLPQLSGLFLAALNFPKPLITAINGHAMAGGCVVACTGDVRIIAEDARIGIPESRVGVPFPAAGMEIMRWAASPSGFRQMISSGATWTGRQAVDAGLADEVCPVDQVLARARERMDELRQVPAAVFALTKRQMRQFVVRAIADHAATFGEEIDDLWRHPVTRQSITRYVRTRLN